MSISSINYSSSILGAQIRNINQQLTDLSTQLSTGKLSQNYSGMGANEGFAIASRSQLSNIAAYTDTITNVNVSINLANTALQSLTTIRNTVQTGAASTAQDVNVNGQTIAQNTAAAQFGSMVGVLNTQSGNRYLFSGTAFNTQSVANAGDNWLVGGPYIASRGFCVFELDYGQEPGIPLIHGLAPVAQSAQLFNQ